MIIRSQDKKCLINFDKVETIAINPGSSDVSVFYNGSEQPHVIGKYTTENQALKVLDEIQRLYAKYVSAITPGDSYRKSCIKYGFEYPKVYEMPQDETEEVK